MNCILSAMMTFPRNTTGLDDLMCLTQVEIPTHDTDSIPSSKANAIDTSLRETTKITVTDPEHDSVKMLSEYRTFTSPHPFPVKYNEAVLPEVTIAFETWGKLNNGRSNAVFIFGGLSGSSHAKSHQNNMKPGWWEKFIGPGCAINTDKFFVICANNLGSCYGTTGPSSINPLTEQPYATTFPVISVEDMVNAQFLLLDHLGIEKLHASIGGSLGGMCSLMAAALRPERVGRMVSIFACARSHPSSIATNYLQRRAVMCDPNWNKGYYYNGTLPTTGLKLAREIGTYTYRCGPEWDERFGRDLVDKHAIPSLRHNFQIESYLNHKGESFCTKYDPNSLLYISKAMDLFDMSEGFQSLNEGLSRVKCPVMVLGVKTDILFPIWQQRELATILQKSGNQYVTFFELNSIYGHDTFLLDLNGVGAAVKGFLETNIQASGH